MLFRHNLDKETPNIRHVDFLNNFNGVLKKKIISPHSYLLLLKLYLLSRCGFTFRFELEYNITRNSVIVAMSEIETFFSG